ncbi:hypothetical protein [Thermoactinomyces sp. DSM 45892]|uniref:hypothetical protein n=1 Tax=Thermoactinomyces sp. DSM 45892 TaxID=1882753 RepID=UPI0008997E21|nr:hypothetical protein [Thermoactinomyces sp. DSM 45892]SDZ00192.1 hypothetical protein SAMN05444416_11187 [Thermoactinomyces sp. DSM 45892]
MQNSLLNSLDQLEDELVQMRDTLIQFQYTEQELRDIINHLVENMKFTISQTRENVMDDNKYNESV